MELCKMSRFFPLVFAIIVFLATSAPSNNSKKLTKIAIIPPNTHFLINISGNSNKTYIYKPPHSLNKTTKISYIINPVSLETPEPLLDLDIMVNVSNARKTVRQCNDILNHHCSLQTDKNNSEMAAAQKLYLYFQCKSPICVFKISILDSKEVRLAPEESHIFFFKKTNSKIFNISIPNKQDFDRVILTVSYSGHRDLKEFYLTPEMNTNSSDPNSCIVYQEARKLIIVIKNNTNLDIYGREISLELIARKLDIYFEIHYMVYEEITELVYDNVFYDNIDDRKYVAYKLKVSNETNEIYFDLKNHFGDKKTLTLSTPESIGKLSNNSDLKNNTFQQHNYLINIDNDLSNILRKEDYSQDSEGFIYFYVAPSLGCFSLEISLKNNRIVPLKLEKFQRKLIQNIEVQNYEIQVFPSDGDVTIDFSMEYGNADLFLKSCKSKCPLFVYDDLNSGTEFMETIKSQDHRLLKFTPNCTTMGVGICKYLITILGNSTFSKSSKYHILIKQGGNHMIDMPENRPVTILIEKDVDYYGRFWLEQDSNLQQVSFSISSISTNFYISNDLACLKNSSCADKMKGDSAHPIFESLENVQNENLVYYIKIKGIKTVKAVFYIEVERKGMPSIINLYEGIPHNGMLDETRKTQLYSFKVDMKKKHTIYVNLNADHEKLLMYGSDHHSLTSMHVFMDKFHKAYHWKSKNGVLEIKPSHKHYSKSTTYYILVTHKQDLAIVGKTNHQYEELSYYIMFSTDYTLKTLQNNVPFYGKIQPNQISFFKFLVNPQEEEVIVTKFLMRESMNAVLQQQDLNMLVSPTPFETLNLSNIMNLTRLFTDEKTETMYNSYHFKKDTLSLLCDVQEYRNYKDICPLYISLTNRGSDEMLYGLTVNIKGMITELFDGVEAASGLSELDGFKEKRFYYKIKDSFKNIDIFSEADFGTHYDVDVMFLDHQKNKMNLFNYKTIDNSVFSSRNKSIHSIQISKEQVQDYCQIHCILMIAISMNYNTSAISTTSYYYQSELIYLLATSETVVLKETRHLIFELKPRQNKYFAYILNDFLENSNTNDSLVISVTPLVGVANFFVLETNDTNPSFPDSFNAQFYSYQSHLTIKKSELASKPNQAVLPELMIGVYSTSGGKFIIDVIEDNIAVLNPDLPLNILILSKQERVYEFANYWFLEGFHVKLYVDSGKGSMLLFRIEDNKLVDEVIFNSKPLFNITLVENKMNSIVVGKDNTAYCWGCSYYVVIQGNTNVQGQLSISEQGGEKQLAMNTLFFDNMIDSEDSIKYRVPIPLDKTTEVILNLYSGSAKLQAGLSTGYFFSDVVYNIEPDVETPNYQKLVVPLRDIIDHYETEMKVMKLKKKDKENYLHTQEMTLKMKVTSLSSAAVNYSIEAYTTDDIRLLKEGVISYSSTNASEKSIFVYEKFSNYTAKSSKKNLSNPHLLIKSLTPGVNLNLDVKVTFVEKNANFYTNSQPISKTLNLTLLSSSVDSLEYLFTNDKLGFYFIEISNTNNKVNLDYFIIISAHKLVTLPNDISLSVSLPKKGTKYFETYLPKKGVLALEILECYGSIKVARTDSYKKLMNKKGMLEEFEVLNDLDYFNYYTVKKPGNFYFLVQSTADEFTNVQISMKFYDTLSQIPQKKLKIPDNGNIEYQVKGNDVSLNFTPVICQKCTNEVTDNVKVTYELMIGNSLFEVDSIGKCKMGYPKFYLKKMKQTPVNENITTLTIASNKNLLSYKENERITFEFVHSFDNLEERIKEKGFKHYFTVKAHITNFPKITNKTKIERMLPAFDLYYETLEVNFKVQNHSEPEEIQEAIEEIQKGKEELEQKNLNYKELLIISIVVIIVLVICVGIGCYFERERRRRHGLIHYSLKETKEKRGPHRSDESTDKMEIEMETKNLSSEKYNPDNF